MAKSNTTQAIDSHFQDFWHELRVKMAAEFDLLPDSTKKLALSMAQTSFTAGYAIGHKGAQTDTVDEVAPMMDKLKGMVESLITERDEALQELKGLKEHALELQWKLDRLQD